MIQNLIMLQLQNTKYFLCQCKWYWDHYTFILHTIVPFVFWYMPVLSGGQSYPKVSSKLMEANVLGFYQKLSLSKVFIIECNVYFLSYYNCLS